MGAPAGNNFWTLRSKHGRELIFSNPTVLIDAVGEYFEKIEESPWYKNEAIKGGDAAGTIVKIPTVQPYTLKGLCHFLDIDFTTWLDYKERPEFKAAIEKVEDFIYNHKFIGATVGVFNANIIARDLGLVDKKDVATDGESLNKGFFDLLKKKRTIKQEKPEL